MPELLTNRLAILSEDTKLIAVLTSALGSEYSIATAFHPDRAERLISEESFAAAILDISSRVLYGQDPGQILEDVLARGVPVIVMADDQTRLEALALLEKGAHSHVHKPPALRELKASLRKALEGQTLRSELDAARRELQNARGLDQLVGSGPQMQMVYKLVQKVADLNASILITGESGTGKELVARAIHNTGQRRERPFVAVSCGAIPDTLIESELFGHQKGAFTGSASVREGYFEKAGDGTLFLDEIGELNHQTQVKLLRVLQQREFFRLGSSRPIPLRARIVLATHRDLDQMVAVGKFRQDLYYRINVLNIKVPSLRQHPEDIPLLVQHFIQKYSEIYKKRVTGIDPKALSLLQSCAWPGNIRELENVLQRVIIMAEEEIIQPADLPDTFQDLETEHVGDDVHGGTFERLIRDYKIKLATEAIQQCNGNKTLAAQKLSISRAYLHRLIRLAEHPEEPELPEMPEVLPMPIRISVAAAS